MKKSLRLIFAILILALIFVGANFQVLANLTTDISTIYMANGTSLEGSYRQYNESNYSISIDSMLLNLINEITGTLKNNDFFYEIEIFGIFVFILIIIIRIIIDIKKIKIKNTSVIELFK